MRSVNVVTCAVAHITMDIGTHAIANIVTHVGTRVVADAKEHCDLQLPELGNSSPKVTHVAITAYTARHALTA